MYILYTYIIIYMYIATCTICMLLFRFNVDAKDHRYLKQLLASKEDEISTMMSSKYGEETMSVQDIWKRSWASEDSISTPLGSH